MTNKEPLNTTQHESYFTKVQANNKIFSTIEKIPIKIFRTAQEGSILVANAIANVIKEKQALDRPCILGLATGSTPTTIYKLLIKMHKEGNLSFKNCVSFNLDEYYPMEPTSDLSYHKYMHENLFNHIDIPKDKIYIPDGNQPEDQINSHCEKYEKLIQDYGGIDVQLLGIGRDGHIGFNEPGSVYESVTRKIALDPLTRFDAFGSASLDSRPNLAITMGIKSIIQARKIFIVAFSENKAFIVKKTIEEGISDQVTASYLQRHDNTLFVLDEAAASCLTRFECPWVVHGPVGVFTTHYDSVCIKKAISWLSQKIKKPILSLEEEDYRLNGLIDILLQNKETVAELNFRILADFQSKLTYWPVGVAPENWMSLGFSEHKTTVHKKVLVFSPHPDNDVICMGATMSKMSKQGHELHVAYQTSGNIAVIVDDVIRKLRFAYKLAIEMNLPTAQKFKDELDTITQLMQNKKSDEADHKKVQFVKGLIRKVEAVSASKKCGVQDANIRFLDQPFYQTGSSSKLPISDKDVNIHKELLKEVKPDVIFCAGDMTDPHGTHRKCLECFVTAIEDLKSAGQDQWLEKTEIWFYRGAWQEWEIEKIDMAVPITKEEIYQKRLAIFQHESQKDPAPFYGNDKREFWQRIESRNRNTAELYKQLGVVSCQALEVFVNYETIKHNIITPSAGDALGRNRTKSILM